MVVYREVRMSDLPYRKAPGLFAALVLAVLLLLAVLAAWGTSVGEFSHWM
jgi:ABC-type transporter Mla subunit MlaD